MGQVLHGSATTTDAIRRAIRAKSRELESAGEALRGEPEDRCHVARAGGCPAAVLFEMADGAQIARPAVASLSFNATIQPVQSAVIAALAHSCAPPDISTAWLGAVCSSAFDYSLSTAGLLSLIAPQASLTVCNWTMPARKEP